MWMRFLLAGPDEQKRGRSKGSKRLVVVTLEKVKDGVGRAYAQIIEAASADEFRPFFKNYINKEATVITDEWTGYSPLKRDYSNLKQIPSNDGKNFPDLHIHIMNLKGWLRGIHIIAVRNVYRDIWMSITIDTIGETIWIQFFIT
jgi:ISXO2-like transposase domain